MVNHDWPIDKRTMVDHDRSRLSMIVHVDRSIDHGQPKSIKVDYDQPWSTVIDRSVGLGPGIAYYAKLWVK